MSNIDLDILKELTDEDLNVICKNADLGMMLVPMKHYGKHYNKYISQLGRLDKKSLLVQKNLPRLAYELYKKGDMNYANFFAQEAIKYKNIFLKMLKEFTGEEAEPNQVSNYTIEDFRKLFKMILDSDDKTLDLELFFMQTRMFDISIKDDIKQQIENEWKYLKEIESIKKELQGEYAQDFKQKEYEIREQVGNKIEKYKEQLKVLEDEIKVLKKETEASEQEIQILKKDLDNERNEVAEKQRLLDKSIVEIDELKEQIAIMQLDINDMALSLKERNDKVYTKIQSEWFEKNKDKIIRNKELDLKSTQLLKEIIELEDKKKKIEKNISEWEEIVEAYFTNIDKKVIEHKIESILFKKGFSYSEPSEAAATSEFCSVNSLYVQKGYKVEEKSECNNYEDYLDIVEVNLLNAGNKMPDGMMSDCFNSAINSGLYPLICGYRARELAMALIASRYAEVPEIISVPAGYGNTSELAMAINSAETNCVIIEDVFGRMNEGIILPILRNSNGKVILFTAESVEDITHLQMHYFNYIQLMVSDKHSIKQYNDFLYADANEILAGTEYTGKEEGYKVARQIFDYIGMNNSYIVTRGSVICNLLSKEKDNSEEMAIFKLLTSEVKWLIKENEKKKLTELFELNVSKYPKNLIECLG